MVVMLFFLGLSILSLMQSEASPIDCSSDQPVINVISTEPLNLLHQGTIVKYENVSIAKLHQSVNVGLSKKYIAARTDARDLLIYTTSYFPNYARDENATSIVLELKFACSAPEHGNRTLIFKQPILLRNYYTPKFAKSLYEVVLPTPIFTGFELTNLVEIAARDNDLTQNKLTFSALNLMEDVLSVSTKAKPDASGKVYYAVLRLNRIFLRLERPIEFELFATDSGTPKRNASSRVRIRQDTKSQLPSLPRFKQNFFFEILNPDLTLPTFKIPLSRGYSANTLSYHLNGSSDATLFNVSSSDRSASVNSLELRLAKTLDMKMLRNRTCLFFMVTAVNKNLNDQLFAAKAVVIVQVPELNENFHFEKSIYVGQISNDYQTLTMTHNIRFNRFGLSPQVRFAVSGVMSQFFQLTQKEYNLTLQLAKNRTLERWSNEDFVTVDLVAHYDSMGFQAAASVFIKLPRKYNNSSMPKEQPEFAKPHYRGTLNNKTGVLKVEPITIINKKFHSSKTEISLIDDYDNNFDCILMDNKVTLKLLKLPKLAMNNESMILLTLQANNGELKGRTTIALELNTNNKSADCSRSIFLHNWIIGKISALNGSEHALYIDAIQLIEGTKAVSFTFELLGDGAEHFEIAVYPDALEVELELKKYLNLDRLQQTELVMEIRAIHKDRADYKNVIVVIIQLQERDSLHQIGSFLPAAPEFSSDNYIFTVSPSDKGRIGFVVATRPGNIGYVSYSLQVNDGELRKRISINARSGELILLSYVNPGIYYFNIAAVEKISLKQSDVQVRLDVVMFLKCNTTKLPEVSNAVIIKHVEEGRAYPELLKVTLDGNCSWVIQDMIPHDKEYVYINKTTQMLSTLPMDYESKIFSDMIVPQVRVLLRLHCLHESSVRKNNSISFDSFNEDIPYTLDTTILKIFIKDVNDNAPEFIYPQNSTILGYPAGKALFEIHPPYLVKVKAIDADKSANGEIEYSLHPNDNFEIDAQSGIIYPKPTVFHDSNYTELQIEAKDHDGLTSSLTLAVHSLPLEFYILLRLEDKGGSDKCEKIFEEISISTQCELVKVKESLLPSSGPPNDNHEIGSFTRSQESRLQLYVWFYAIRNKEPIASVSFQDLITSQGLFDNDTSITFKSLADIVTGTKQSNDTVKYIVAIAILAIIGLTCLSFLLYSFECWNWKNKRSKKIYKFKSSAKDVHGMEDTDNSTISTVSQVITQQLAVLNYKSDKLKNDDTSVSEYASIS